MKADLLHSLSGHGPHRSGTHAIGKGRGAAGHDAFAAVLDHVDDGTHGMHGMHAFAFDATSEHKSAFPGSGNAATSVLPGGVSTSTPMSAAFDAWANQRGLHGLGAQQGGHFGTPQDAQFGAASSTLDLAAHVGAHVEAAVQRALGTAAAQLRATGPSSSTLDAHAGHDVEDSLWSERTTASGKATAAAKRRVGTDDDVAAVDTVEAKRDEEKKPGDEQKQSSTSTQSPTQAWALSTMTTSPTERVDAVREVPPGPLMVATDHLRALLPEGGRVLAASASHVSLELPHLSGPMLLDIHMKSGVVDVRARGGAAAEMAWRVPELAAALQSAGVRLGSFEVAPMKKSGDASAADDGPAGDRQNSDDLQPRLRRPEPRGVVAGLAHAFSA